MFVYVGRVFVFVCLWREGVLLFVCVGGCLCLSAYGGKGCLCLWEEGCLNLFVYVLFVFILSGGRGVFYASLWEGCLFVCEREEYVFDRMWLCMCVCFDVTFVATLFCVCLCV